MAIKRKGFIWAAIFFTVLNLIMGLIVVGFTLFDLIDVRRRIGIPVMTTFRFYISQVLGLVIFLVLFSLLTLWIVSAARKKNGFTAALVIVVHLSVLIASICLSVALCKLTKKPPLSPTDLLHYTEMDMVKMREDGTGAKPIVPWLDDIQKKSRVCCGIVEFRDWETFWGVKREVPASCCLADRRDCVTNFKRLVYPDLVSHNIKMDDGCHSEINAKVAYVLVEARNVMVILTVFVAFSLAAYCALYLVVFYLKPSAEEEDDYEEIPAVSSALPPEFPEQDTNWANLQFFAPKKKSRKNKLPLTFLPATAGGSGTNSINQAPNAQNWDQQQQQQMNYRGPDQVQIFDPSKPSAQPQTVQYRLDYISDGKSGTTQFIPEIEDGSTEDLALSTIPSVIDQDGQEDLDPDAPRRHRHIHVRGFMKRSRRRPRSEK